MTNHQVFDTIKHLPVLSTVVQGRSWVSLLLSPSPGPGFTTQVVWACHTEVADAGAVPQLERICSLLSCCGLHPTDWHLCLLPDLMAASSNELQAGMQEPAFVYTGTLQEHSDSFLTQCAVSGGWGQYPCTCAVFNSGINAAPPRPQWCGSNNPLNRSLWWTVQSRFTFLITSCVAVPCWWFIDKTCHVKTEIKIRGGSSWRNGS